MSNRTTQHTPPAAPRRHKLALVSWAGAYGLISLIVASTWAPGSRSWAPAGRAS